MSKIFYDDLVIREEITLELDNYQLSKEERDDLLNIIDETLHHHILNLILNHLPKTKHQEFVSRLHARPGDSGLLDFLKTHAGSNIEEDIKSHAAKIKKDILSEIHKAKKPKSP
jgi:hypothetical protein